VSNLRESVVTISGSIPADGKTSEKVFTFTMPIRKIHAVPSVKMDTTRTIVVDATQHLEAGITTSGN
jgi:hypothetical protein